MRDIRYHFETDGVRSISGLLGATSVTGEAGENNCYPCNGGSVPGGVVSNVTL